MHVKKFVCGPLKTNCYLVWDEGKAVLIDAPQRCSQPVLDELAKRNLELVLVVNTHGHWDHIADNAELKEKTGAKIAVHKGDEKMLWSPPDGVASSRADTHLDESDLIRIGSAALEVIETPGHSPGSVCLYGAGMLFSGDTLFAGSHGRTDFPGGDHSKMLASLKKLLKLPPETKVHPGHGPETALGKERWIGHM
ncbi:MAG: MBL fold metallo-hydrolase [Candidatus Aenigmarchaeota archaeon]|nr:MBL fold metallo-hydrolase [Candidatus Aenigmarchaeota archaeon]